MAVATATIIGIAATGASTAMSFSNAAKQKRAAETAATESKKLMAEARKNAEKDYYAGLAVPLDAYEAEFETNLAAQTQSVEALQEGDSRALAAGVGRIGAQQQAGAEKTRIAMGEELYNLDKMKADSKEGIKQQLVGMDVGAAKDAAQTARDMELAQANSLQQGMQGIAGVASGIGQLAPLYGQKKADKTMAKEANLIGMDITAYNALTPKQRSKAVLDWQAEQNS